MPNAARPPTCSLIGLTASLLLACDATPIEDDLAIESSASVTVDATCPEPCITDALANVEVSYVDRDQPAGEVLSLTGYRVTYRVPDLDDRLPPFEDELSEQLAPGETQTLSLPVAGPKQRSAVLAAGAGEDLEGSALLTLLGADRDGEHVELEATLMITFRRGLGGVTADAEQLSMAVPASVRYPMRLYRRDRPSEPCVADLGSDELEDRDVECLADINELDLFVLGVSFETSASEGACDFVQHGAPIFPTFPVGEGPTHVAFTRYEDGSVSEEVNAEAGEPVCPFDYSPSGPDCCYGEYTLEVTSATHGTTTVSHGSWGSTSELAPCYEGAAFYGTDLPLSANGFPADRIIHIARDPYTETRVFEGLSASHPRISYPLANYYDPDDHGGEAPAPFRDLGAREHYEFICLDDAEEMVGRIRLTVREWNEEREFDREGDPDVEGEERDWATPLNDLLDWKDLAEGAGEYPMIPRPEAM